MRFYSIIIFFICFVNLLCSQTEEYVVPMPRDYKVSPAKNAAFIELGGNSGLFSLNFDRIYYYKDKFKMSGRLGFAPHFNGIYIEQEYLVEHNFIFFKNPHHLELGLGATLQRRYNERLNETDNYFWENVWFSVWRCGYRFQKQDDCFFFRAGLTPVIMSKNANEFDANYFQFWAGISLGLSF